jgi:hypothetical protein
VLRKNDRMNIITKFEHPKFRPEDGKELNILLTFFLSDRGI